MGYGTSERATSPIGLSKSPIGLRNHKTLLESSYFYFLISLLEREYLNLIYK
jgi:hypothetical protein